MLKLKLALLSSVVIVTSQSNICFAQDVVQAPGANTTPASTSPPSASVPEVIVTAQKRSENINKVGLSVQALSGDQLIQLGAKDTAQLSKAISGFNFTQTENGTPIYTIRGVGFQDLSLASNPTVSVYRDEIPLPYAIESAGASLDLQRVEVLKGPQGTLFGENATGGAINYIVNKPTDHFVAGLDASYSRFNRLDVEGYLGGPITDTLDYRAAVRVVNSDDWQVSNYNGATSGAARFYDGRVSLLWKPTSRLKALFTVEGWIDNTDDQQAQLFGFNYVRSGGNNITQTGGKIDPRILAYPLALQNDRSAGFGACVNTSPFDTPLDNIAKPYGYSPTRAVTPSNCTGFERDNTFYSGSARLDYDIGGDMTLTSLTTYELFDRYQPVDDDGTVYQNYENVFTGHLATAYQELRLAGKFYGRGSWIVGGNYEHDGTADSFLNSLNDSSTSVVDGILLGPSVTASKQQNNTYAAFGDFQYPVLQKLTLDAGARFTQSDQSYNGCAYDGGDGSISNLFYLLQVASEKAGKDPVVAVNRGPGGCDTLSAAPTFVPPAGGYDLRLDQNNVSWRVGLDYNATPGTLLYVDVSRGYKAGSFPTLSALTYLQLQPAVQESLLAYEVGEKSRLLHSTLQLNSAFFYYDYTNKQVLGDTPTIFGSLPRLVNVPTSHVIGVEASAVWRPIPPLTITPSISYAHSEIDGDFSNYTPFGQVADFKGEPFPNAPELTGNVDAQYTWRLSDQLEAYVGSNANYQSGTSAALYDRTSTIVAPTQLDLPHYWLVDMRAGVNRGPVSLQIWGRNITDKYYWNNARPINDVLVRYAGRPVTYGATLTYRYQ